MLYDLLFLFSPLKGRRLAHHEVSAAVLCFKI
jgi:hypothetical protein